MGDVEERYGGEDLSKRDTVEVVHLGKTEPKVFDAVNVDVIPAGEEEEGAGKDGEEDDGDLDAKSDGATCAR